MSREEATTILVLDDGTICSIALCVEPGSSHTPEFLKQQIINAMKSMSPGTRWQRFASSGNLSDTQLDYLTNLDGKDRVAWCAAVEKGGSEVGIGLCRYIRLVEEGNVAEFALTVIDEYQRKGIGTALLGKVIDSARENNIAMLRGYVLSSNKPMLSLCKKLGAAIHVDDANFRVVEISVH